MTNRIRPTFSPTYQRISTCTIQSLHNPLRTWTRGSGSSGFHLRCATLNRERPQTVRTTMATCFVRVPQYSEPSTATRSQQARTGKVTQDQVRRKRRSVSRRNRRRSRREKKRGKDPALKFPSFLSSCRTASMAPRYGSIY